MTRIEFFEAGYALTGVRIGVISPDMLSKYDRYLVYLDLLKSGQKKSQALILASDQCNCDRATVAKTVYWFERDDAVRNSAQNIPIETATLVQ